MVTWKAIHALTHYTVIVCDRIADQLRYTAEVVDIWAVCNGYIDEENREEVARLRPVYTRSRGQRALDIVRRLWYAPS